VAAVSGSVALRGELWLNFIYVNPQKMGNAGDRKMVSFIP